MRYDQSQIYDMIGYHNPSAAWIYRTAKIKVGEESEACVF